MMTQIGRQVSTMALKSKSKRGIVALQKGLKFLQKINSLKYNGKVPICWCYMEMYTLRGVVISIYELDLYTHNGYTFCISASVRHVSGSTFTRPEFDTTHTHYFPTIFYRRHTQK